MSCLIGRIGHVKNAVYVVRDGKARRSEVRVGNEDGKEVEIVAGLKAGDRVVADPKGLKGDEVAVEVKEDNGPS